MNASKREGLARAGIVTTAISLLDETGLDGLTMRRLATELGVQNPALYWHFRNKQELLDEMSEAIQLSGDHGPPRTGESWQDWMTRRGKQRRRLLLKHRDGARLIAGTYPGPLVMKRFEEELTALAGCGFTPVTALRAIGSVSHYVTGFVLEEQAARQRSEPGAREIAFDPQSPLLSAIRQGGDPLGNVAFEQGLRLLIDGIQASLDRDEGVRPGA